MEKIIEFSLIIWLLALSWQDMKKKEVSVLLLGTGTAIALASIGVSLGMKPDVSIWISKGAGMLFGMMLIGLSKLSKGGIGMGDSIVLTITGVMFGFWTNLCLFFYSLVLSAVYAGVLLIIKKIHKKQSIAFIPFILFGTLGVIFI